MSLFLIKVEILLAIVAITLPSSKIYLILEAINTSKIVGKAAKIPFKKLFNVVIKSLFIIKPDIIFYFSVRSFISVFIIIRIIICIIIMFF